MQKIAIVFPGQGSQSVGMLSQFSDRFPIVKETYQEASEVLGFNLWIIVNSGPAEELDKTIYTQPAMLAADVALWKIFQQVNGNAFPGFLAGHSLGEYAALVAAEAIDFSEAIKLVAERARLMQEAIPVGEGAMGVILNLPEDQIETLCRQVSSELNLSVAPANFNAPKQVVIAGYTQAVDKTLGLAKDMGAKMAKKLPMSVISHCALMKPASEKLALFLKNITVKPPKIPVIQNADNEMHNDSASIKNSLIQQLYRPVCWTTLILKMADLGCDTFLECGPGKVLTGLNKRIIESGVFIPLSEQIELEDAYE